MNDIFYHFIKIDGKSIHFFYGFADEMETTLSPPPSQSIVNALALTEFLNNASSKGSPIRLTDLLNPTNPENQRPEVNVLFLPEGILHGPKNKSERKRLMDIFVKNGVQLQGENPANQFVVFPQNFQSLIPDIVDEFLSNPESVSSAKPAAAVNPKKQHRDAKPRPVICPNGHVCDSKDHMCTGGATGGRGGGAAGGGGAAAAAGGGAAAHRHYSSKPQQMTLAQLQKQKNQELQAKERNEKPLTCVVCQSTKPDGSGTCKYKQCDNYHPYNVLHVVINEHSKNGKPTFYTAVVCQGFNNGSCPNGETCPFAHLSIAEYNTAVEKDRIRRESKAAHQNVSSKKQPGRPKMIVPSQVQFKKQQQQHPHLSGKMSMDPLIRAGLFEVAAGLQEFAFEGSDVLSDLSNFMRGQEEIPLNGDTESWWPDAAVEVPDSSDDEESEQGD